MTQAFLLTNTRLDDLHYNSLTTMGVDRLLKLPVTLRMPWRKIDAGPLNEEDAAALRTRPMIFSLLKDRTTPLNRFCRRRAPYPSLPCDRFGHRRRPSFPSSVTILNKLTNAERAGDDSPAFSMAATYAAAVPLQ